MKVILLQDVKGTGKKDQVLQVSDGFARNFLFPRKWAVEASAGAVKVIERKRAVEEKKEQEQKDAALEKAKFLKDKVIVMNARCGDKGRLYGSITTQEIADALAKQHSMTVDKRKIELSEPIRTIGDVEVSVWVYPGVTTKMKVHIQPESK